MPDASNYEKWLADDASDRWDWRVKYREYFDGEHNTQLTERQRDYLSLAKGEDFRANYCKIVVNALAERLTVIGFDLGEEAELGEAVTQWWQWNRLDAQQNMVHTAALRDGDSYVMIDYDNDRKRPIISFEMAYNGEHGVECVYGDDRSKPLFAFKRWCSIDEDGDPVERLTLYTASEIAYYVEGEGGQWEQDGTPKPWRPGRLPVVHFKNDDQGYNYGNSELHDIIPLQNALNKAIIDLVAAADTTAFRIYWMLGDDPSELEIVPGSWVWSPRPPSGEEPVAVGMFPGEDLSHLIEFKDTFTLEMARISQTPVSYFQAGGQRAAEGTLKQEEVGLVRKGMRRTVTFGNAWEDVVLTAIAVHNAYSGEILADPDELVISAQWGDLETRNELQYLQTLALKVSQLKVPVQQAWIEAGYDETKRAEFQKEMLKAQARQQLIFARGQQQDEEDEDEEEQGDEGQQNQPPPPPGQEQEGNDE
jgi:hypothetical protein